MPSDNWPEWLDNKDQCLIDVLFHNGVISEVEYEDFRYQGDLLQVESLDSKRFEYYSEQVDFYNPLRLLKLAPFWMRDIKIDNFSTSVRLRNIFAYSDIETVGCLLNFNITELLSLRGMGRKSLFDLSKSLIELSKNKPKDISILRERSEFNKQDQPIKLSWFSSMLERNTALQELLYNIGINDEASYLKNKNLLSSQLMNQVEDFRFNVLINYVDQKNPLSILGITSSWLLDTEIKKFPCSVRIKNVATSLDIIHLRDFLKFEFMALERMPNMGIKSIRELADLITLAQSKGPPPTLENPLTYDRNLYDCFLRSINSLDDERHRFVIFNRFGVGCSPKTLEEIGVSLKITRERVRQIQKKITQKITDEEYWDDSLKFKILRRFNERYRAVILEEIVEDDPWFVGFSDQIELLKRIIDHFSNLSLHILTINEQTVVARISEEQWQQCKSEVLEFLEHSLEMNYSFEDVELIIEHQLTEYDAAELTDLLLDDILRVLNFSNIEGESTLVNIGNSRSSRLNVILEESKTPLHYSEVRVLYEEKYGITVTERQIHTALSHYNFHLFGRGTFGLPKHLPITLERLSEIVEKAEQLANKNRSKQWHCSELLRKLIGLNEIFEHEKIDKYVLNIGLQISSKFRYLGKMVWICDDIENINVHRIQLKDAIPVIIRDNGSPMTVREIEVQLKKSRGVGYDITQQLYLSDLIARTDPGHWGLLSRDFEKPLAYWNYIKGEILDHLENCDQALHKSEVIEVLAQRGVSDLPKINLLLGIVSCDKDFRTWHGGFLGLVSQDSPNRLSLAQALTKVLNSQDVEFTTNEVIDSLSAYVSFPYNRSRLSKMINDSGFQFEAEAGVWIKQDF